MRAVITDLKTTLSSSKFILAVIVCVVTLIIASANDLYVVFTSKEDIKHGIHGTIALSAIRSDLIVLILPVLCAIPYATRFVEDIKSHFVIQYLPRAGVKEYILGKIVVSILSGGLVLLLGILIYFGLLCIVVMPMETKLLYGEQEVSYIGNVISHALCYACSGGFWALFGFTLGSISMNKYMCYASGFIGYYILIILKERYFREYHMFYPKEWLNPGSNFSFGMLGVFVILVEICVLLGLIFAVYAKRRLISE
ncbi:hypothetical protein lbkm_4169 [Lachnospiraceae bacterium KM106-2]|nr:hypothetical protein lbkm_4169 [Lachnospiraceae bacterium KM106-2]